MDNVKWISVKNYKLNREFNCISPALEFRKDFLLDTLNNAKIKICGLGYFYLLINGKKVGDDVLSPLYSQYNKHVYFNEYDINSYLKLGKNTIAIILGDGFYNQTTHDTWNFYEAEFRDVPKLYLSITIDDKEVLTSDESFKSRISKTYYHSAVRTGEWYDARYEDGFEKEEYDDSSWDNSVFVEPPKGVLLKNEMPLIKECETYKPTSTWKSVNGYILEFPYCMSGYVGFSLKSFRDNTLKIRYADRLTCDRELDQSNINPYVLDTKEYFSTDIYTFKSNEVETHKPLFVYHGFKYIEVVGLNEIDKDDFTAYFVHTDLKKIGDFISSSEMLNWLYDAGVRSFLSNYHSIPTDCPHREKNGWTNDAWLSSNYSVILYDMKESYKKFIQDLVDTQNSEGNISNIAPNSKWGYVWGCGPSTAICLFYIPYVIYMETGSEELFNIIFEAGKKYILFGLSKKRENGLIQYGLGDWNQPKTIPKSQIMSNVLSDSCYFYIILKIFSVISKHKSDYSFNKLCEDESALLKDRILNEFVDDDVVDNDTEGALSIVLYANIIDDDLQKHKILNKLIKKIEENNYLATVGIFGMEAMFRVLEKYDRDDVLYKLLMQDKYPSYGYMKKCGATTIWESFEGDVHASLIHHMFNQPITFLFRHIGGLINIGIGYDSFIVKPYIFEKNCSSNVYKITKYGKIAISWHFENDIFKLQYKKPPRCFGKLIYKNNEYELPFEKGEIII